MRTQIYALTRRLAVVATLLLASTTFADAQVSDDYNEITSDGNITTANQRRRAQNDSLGTDQEIPMGLYVWTVDQRFGDRQRAIPDTVPDMFMNTIFTTGLRGEYNTTGNLGTPRINRIFIDQPETEQFIFTQPYDYFIQPVEKFHFTNTLSPFTNLSYNTCGDRTNGEDHFTAKFGVNAGKRIGLGFHFNYLYGRGYYQNQSTAHFNYTMYGSYLGDRYQAHLLLSTNHQKVTENGGITDDNYITHPESFSENYQTSEIPTVLEENWNRNDNQHLFLSHRYSVGFNRKVKMTEEEIKAKKFAIEAQKDKKAREARDREARDAKREGRQPNEKPEEEQQFAGRPDDAKVVEDKEMPTPDQQKSERISVTNKAQADSLLRAEHKKENLDTAWLKNEYVPVTSFIHTLKMDNYKRIYEAYQTTDDFYANTFYNIGRLTGDSIYDQTKHYRIKNTFAISLLEGFNKWVKAGLKGFVSSDLRHFTLPDSLGGTSTWNEHNLSIGGQLSKTQGRTLHFDVIAETWLTGEDAGQLKIDGTADLNFALFGDTVTLAAKAFVHRLQPTFYFRHYHARHFWWDNDGLDKIFHSRIEGVFSYQKTNTTLRVAVDEIKNHTYLAQSYTLAENLNHLYTDVNVRQCGDAISLITASLTQNFKFGPLNWQSVITWQKSTNEDVLSVPDLNIYTNLFLNFRIARVLRCDLGADLRWFTKYYAPDYSPALGQFAVQEGDNRTEVGNYPIVNVFANFHLKHTRFFVMMSHVNAGMGKMNYFLTPHYPLNERLLRFGVSWNFFN